MANQSGLQNLRLLAPQGHIGEGLVLPEPIIRLVSSLRDEIVSSGTHNASLLTLPNGVCLRGSVLELITADLAIGADFVAPTPLLIVHGRADAFTTPAQALAAFERAGEPKKLVWLDTTNHIDLYDVPEYVEPAVAAAVAWFDGYLAPA